MNFDPFHDPFRTAQNPSNSDILRRRIARGASRQARPSQSPDTAREPHPVEAGSVGEEENFEVKATEARVHLRNPVWEVEDVGFNEETVVSVEAEIPEAQAHRTRVEFQLFAETPDGPEYISKCEGTVKEGKAFGKIPVYIPQYRDAGGSLLSKVVYFFTAKHSLSDLLQGDQVTKAVDHLAERLIRSHILPDVTFSMGKSFIRAGSAEALKLLTRSVSAWKKEHPDGKLAVFGHADAIGKETPNKQLSERRADTVYGFLVKDPAVWKALYDTDRWGLASTQELLKALGHDPGAIDGLDGPKTQQAMKAFQSNVGLPPTGQADPATRERLYRACMDAWNPESLASRDFDSIDGKPRAGCSEFNLAEKTEGACEKNRRVSVFLLKSNRNFPIVYPCKDGDLGPCQKQKGRKATRRTPGFQCLFYDQLVTEVASPPLGSGQDILEVGWEKSSLLAWNYQDTDETTTRVKVKTSAMEGAWDAFLEIFQFRGSGKHTSLGAHALKLEGDKLYTKDGKEFLCRIPWHATLYDHAGLQYFFTLKVGELEKTSPQTREGLLRLKHIDSCVADPKGDLPFAAKEGEWFDRFISTNGPWMEATSSTSLADGHVSEIHGSISTAEMGALLDGNRFIHHQSSHGGAYCSCNGRRNYLRPSIRIGADGFFNELCPACGTSENAIGFICLKNSAHNFFIEHVESLEHGPKTLLFANCCTTAVTDSYPKAWNSLGTRWYIGWALSVNDKAAGVFAQAFYERWIGHYDMDPDKVEEAWGDVKGPFSRYRPRIYGK